MRNFGYAIIGGSHGVVTAMGDIYFSDPAYWLTLAPMLLGAALIHGVAS